MQTLRIYRVKWCNAAGMHLDTIAAPDPDEAAALASRAMNPRSEPHDDTRVLRVIDRGPAPDELQGEEIDDDQDGGLPVQVRR